MDLLLIFSFLVSASKSSSPFSLFFLFLREMLNPEFDGKTRGRDFALFSKMCSFQKKKEEKEKREKKT